MMTGMMIFLTIQFDGYENYFMTRRAYVRGEISQIHETMDYGNYIVKVVDDKGDTIGEFYAQNRNPAKELEPPEHFSGKEGDAYAIPIRVPYIEGVHGLELYRSSGKEQSDDVLWSMYKEMSAPSIEGFSVHFDEASSEYVFRFRIGPYEDQRENLNFSIEYNRDVHGANDWWSWLTFRQMSHQESIVIDGVEWQEIRVSQHSVNLMPSLTGMSFRLIVSNGISFDAYISDSVFYEPFLVEGLEIFSRHPSVVYRHYRSGLALDAKAVGRDARLVDRDEILWFRGSDGKALGRGRTLRLNLSDWPAGEDTVVARGFHQEQQYGEDAVSVFVVRERSRLEVLHGPSVDRGIACEHLYIDLKEGDPDLLVSLYIQDRDGRLRIPLQPEQLPLQIHYSGLPAKGLVVGEDKTGYSFITGYEIQGGDCPDD